jgi:hypothetical protein
MSSLLPNTALNISSLYVPFGFSSNRTGGHMARSMMLQELNEICRSLPESSVPSDYQRAIEQENLLGKPTFSSRQKSYRHLVELYGLNPNLPLFRVLRRFATEDPASIPLMGMICCFCRDPQLRQSFSLIDSLKPGEVLPRARMEAHLEAGFPDVFSEPMKKSLAQNVNTTWTVTGHLYGRSTKRRDLPKPRPSATAYAMFAGWLSGLRSQILLNSVFGHLVALTPDQMLNHLSEANAHGWLRLRNAGGVTEIDFSPLLTQQEQDLIHVTH